MHVHFLGEADDGRSISSHHARALAGLGVEVSFSTSEKLDAAASRDADVVHVVTRGLVEPKLLRDILRLRSAGKPVARMWTGEDVLWAIWHAPARAVAHGLYRTGVRQFCRSPEEADRLGALGIEASVLPALSINVCVRSEPQPLPKQLTMLCLLPARQREYYGGELIDSLARWLPSVRFLVLTDAAQSSDAKNVEYLTFVEDVGRSIQRATAVIHARLDRAVSRLIIEALSHGRHVVAGCAFPHTIQANSIDDYLNAMRALGREAAFNLAGREYVGKNYDWRVVGEALLHTMRRMSHEQDWAGGVRGGLARAANLVREPLAEPTVLPDPESLPPEAHAFRALLRATLPEASTPKPMAAS